MADEGALYLLDGNSLVYRAFFALPIDLATKAGQVTNVMLSNSNAIQPPAAHH